VVLALVPYAAAGCHMADATGLPEVHVMASVASLYVSTAIRSSAHYATATGVRSYMSMVLGSFIGGGGRILADAFTSDWPMVIRAFKSFS
jgi:hypothetical protein